LRNLRSVGYKALADAVEDAKTSPVVSGHKEDTQNQNAAEKRRAISVATEKTFKSRRSDQNPSEKPLEIFGHSGLGNTFWVQIGSKLGEPTHLSAEPTSCGNGNRSNVYYRLIGSPP
jgi:hypothetical protein